jgi:hypothetical protein
LLQCTSFVGEYEDELTRTFFNDFTPAKDRMCINTLQGTPCTNCEALTFLPVTEDVADPCWNRSVQRRSTGRAGARGPVNGRTCGCCAAVALK